VKIKDECVVGIHYTLTSDDGKVIDSSQGKDPLRYLHGGQNLVPGLERELTGHAVADHFKVVVQPEDGYGVVDPELVQRVDRSVLGGIDDLQVGMQMEASSPEGHSQFVIVQEIDGDVVVLNGNAPLAGLVLHFEITIDSIRDATPEELEHGHPH
jgi:FKBP-type peptidyl-prolyl cis-trans isomerase SlyD